MAKQRSAAPWAFSTIAFLETCLVTPEAIRRLNTQDHFNFPFQTVNSALPAGSFAGATAGPLPSVVPNTTPSASIPDGSQLAPVLFDVHFRNPVSDNWNFGIQHEFAGNTVVDLSYVGSKGTHIFREVNGNPQDPALVNQLVAFCSNPTNSFTNVFGQTTSCVPSEVTKANLFNGFDNGVLPFNAVENNALDSPFFIRSVGNSSYNSLQLKVTHSLRHGLCRSRVRTPTHMASTIRAIP